MTDLYLQALMQGEVLKKNMRTAVSNFAIKNKFDKEIEKEIDAYIADLPLEEGNPDLSKLTTPEMRRSRLKAELLEQAKLSELAQFIDSSFKILTSEAQNYLDQEHLALMNKDFINANEILTKIDLSSSQADNFKTLLHFSNATLESIIQIALAKYSESRFLDSLSLFILLSTLIPENPEFWYRAGICAHKCENYELASRLYSAVTTIDPSLIAPWAFSIDCFLKREMKPEAKNAYDEAIKLYEASHEESWKVLLSENELILKNS